MPFLPHLLDLSPLYIVQAALTIWMIVDANRRGVEGYWFWVILFFQPFGAWAYFFLYKVKDFHGRGGSLANLFQRRAGMAELRHRVERSPTPANRLELASRFVEDGNFEEAAPLLEYVLDREPEHCGCLFLLARTYRGLKQPARAVPLLQRLIARQSNWGDYRAWHLIIEVSREAGDTAEAIASSRELARIAPTLEHKCILATLFIESNEDGEAAKVLDMALEEYQFATGMSRRRDRRWVGKARQLLRKIEEGQAG